jgi:hypothetical protein
MNTAKATCVAAAATLLAICVAATTNVVSRSTSKKENHVLSLFPVLADPARFNGQEIQIEAFVASAEGHYVLAPTLSCIGNSTGPSLVNLDISECRGKEKLANLNPGICYLRGVVDALDLGGPPPMAFTFRAKQCESAVRARGLDQK